MKVENVCDISCVGNFDVLNVIVCVWWGVVLR